VTTYEVAARNKKVAALVAVLRQAGISASMLAEANDHDWFLAANAAHVNPPSETTRALALAKLAEPAEEPMEPTVHPQQAYDEALAADERADREWEYRFDRERGSDRTPERE
jgi:hypothetical protein